jgi:ribosomal protein S18 acetylase RimI-like enzyme
LVIRLIKKNETNIESILKIDSQTFDSPIFSFNEWSLTTFIRYGKIFGLFNQNSLIGFILYMRSYDDPKFSYIAKLAVESGSQGKGYGSYLLKKTLLKLKRSGISFVGLTVDPNNSGNMHLYRDKFGFEVTAYHKNEYGVGYDRYFMTLNLENFDEKEKEVNSATISGFN